MKLCVEWWSIITSWHINVHYVKNLRTYECEVKHNRDMGMGHLMWGGEGGGGIYHIMGGVVMAKLSYFIGKYVQRMLVFMGGPFSALEFSFVSTKF